MADLVITPALVLASFRAKDVRPVKWGATIAQGEVVFEDPSDGFKCKLADANAGLVSTQITKLWFALTAGANNQPGLVCSIDEDFTPGGTLVAGLNYILSATPGKICPEADAVAGWRKYFLFTAKTTTLANLSITGGGLV